MKRAVFVAVIAVAGALGVLAIDEQDVLADREGSRVCYKTKDSFSVPRGSIRWFESGSQGSCNGDERELAASDLLKGSLMTEKLANAELMDARLMYLSLDRVNFSGSNLGSARLNGSSLVKANFSKAILSTTVFDFVDARQANFSDITEMYVSSRAGDFAGSDLSRSTNIRLEGGNFSDAKFFKSSVSGITDANLTNVDFRTTIFIPSSTFINRSNLTNANFSKVEFNGRVDFASNDLTRTNFAGAKFIATDDENYTEFNGSVMKATNFRGVRFENVVFQGVDMTSTQLTGTTWKNTICPDGTNSDNNGATCLGHLKPLP
ncbi:MAG TPA: pentapeptide repeat-containing protein [Candidatus Saccharimonadales bacterium]|jgi:uncharacterized protein YjbI with pentapeptide repeats